MKTCCKNVDISDADLIEKSIWKAISGKYGRNAYINFLAEYGTYDKKHLHRLYEDTKYGVISPEERKETLKPNVKNIVAEIQSQFRNQELKFDPVRYEKRFDKGTQKWRTIGIECPLQQIIEHVCCFALDELWHRKICPHQYSSLDRRGQLKGAKQISRWVKRGLATYFVKLDIRKCFDNIRHDDIMRRLKRDIGKNFLLLWLASCLLNIHGNKKKGLIVGSWLSSLLCNYLLSYAYRYVSGLYTERRGKKIYLINRTLFFMDDILIIGSNKKNLKIAVNKLSAYLMKEYGLEIKPNYEIKEIAKEPVTMMGFTIFSDGKVKIRRKNFVKIRRAFIRTSSGKFGIEAARRCSAYNSYFANTDTQDVWKLPHGKNINVPAAVKRASKFTSEYDRKRREHYVEQSRIYRATGKGLC